MAALSWGSEADHVRVKSKASWFIKMCQICVAQETDKVYEQKAITWVSVDQDVCHWAKLVNTDTPTKTMEQCIPHISKFIYINFIEYPHTPKNE